MSENVDNAISYVFMWNALSDACPKCQALNGSEFRDQNVFQNTLWAASGDIWDLDNDRSLVHPNCRCQLTVRVIFDWNKIREIGELQDVLQDYGLPRPEFEVIDEEIPTVSEARNAVSQLKSELHAALPNIREANQSLTLFVALRRELGFSGDIWELVAILQQIRLSADMAVRGIMMVYAGTGPVGWFLGGATALLGLFSAMSIRRPQY
jgi:hypothetical protein